MRTLALCKFVAALVPLCLPGGFGVLASIPAAECTWTGGSSDTNWSTPQNWAVAPPVPTIDTLVFTGDKGVNNHNDSPKGSGFTGIIFDQNAAAFSLSGNAIGLGGNVFNRSTRTQNINMFLTLRGDRTFTTMAGGGNIILNGNIGGDSGIIIAGDGVVTLNRATTYLGKTTIRSGTLLLGDGGAIGASAGVVLQGGTLAIGANGLSAVAGALTVSAPSVIDFKGVGQKLLFKDSRAQTWTGKLSVYHWDRSNTLTFGKDNDALTGEQLDRIAFYSDAGSTLLDKGTWPGHPSEITDTNPPPAQAGK
jgi:autotransporter-associated beta strand protein